MIIMRYAPFTPDEVTRINAFQRCDTVHPFTCHEEHVGRDRTLVATVDGMVCPTCGYTQAWVHEFMAKWDGVERWAP